MRAAFIGIAALSALTLPGSAWAQTTIITQDPPAVVTAPGPGGVVERAGPDVPPTTGSVTTPPGCSSTVTRQDNPDGTATTVRQERCNPE